MNMTNEVCKVILVICFSMVCAFACWTLLRAVKVTDESSKNKKGKRIMKPEVYFAKLHDEAIIPSKRREDAAYDIYARSNCDRYLNIQPGETKMVPTGIISACSDDYCFKLEERGSMGSQGIALRCGIIDSGYRGEWFVALTNTTNRPLVIELSPDADTCDTAEYGDYIYVPYNKAICQARLCRVYDAEVLEITSNAIYSITSSRGAGKLGSSGK